MTKPEKARGEVRRLCDVERTFAQRLRRKHAEAAAVVGPAVGDEILAVALAETQPDEEASGNGRVDALLVDKGDRLTRLSGEVASLESAIRAARRARRAAILECWRLEAQQKRQEAAKLREQAEKIDAKAQPHLDALREIYGVPFVPAACVPVAAAASANGSMAPVGAVAVPSTTALLAQAGDLEREAIRLSTKQIAAKGAVAVDGTVEDLLGTLAAKSFTMAPPLPEVLDWAEAGAQEAHRTWNIERRCGRASVEELDALRLRFTLVWRNEQTIQAESSVSADLRVRDEQGAVV
jgi:hypothetical protein